MVADVVLQDRSMIPEYVLMSVCLFATVCATLESACVVHAGVCMCVFQAVVPLLQ